MRYPRAIARDGRGDVAALACDLRKLKAELGWTPRYASSSYTVQTALDWERKTWALPTSEGADGDQFFRRCGGPNPTRRG